MYCNTMFMKIQQKYVNFEAAGVLKYNLIDLFSKIVMEHYTVEEAEQSSSETS